MTPEEASEAYVVEAVRRLASLLMDPCGGAAKLEPVDALRLAVELHSARMVAEAIEMVETALAELVEVSRAARAIDQD